MTADYPTMEQVEADDVTVEQLLEWNQHLPAPEEGTEEYEVLAAIVAKLRGIQADVAQTDGAELPHADHPGWPFQ
ncbi:MAG: hypothetical protein QOF36_2592 [Microbacteriaceae bacterium]|jgi:hypothetical protein|nr:hypothetical protein [Microbacteriaceae bacterium]